jgi:hypothetical protein
MCRIVLQLYFDTLALNLVYLHHQKRDLMDEKESNNSWISSWIKWLRACFISENTTQSDDISAIRLVRSLSVSYTFNGKETMDDPACYEGEEREQRSNSIIEQCPNTGYAYFFRQKKVMNEEDINLLIPEDECQDTKAYQCV